MARARRVLVPSAIIGVALLLALSCESPFEPRGVGERVPIGLVIEDEVRGDTANWYSFSAGPKQLFVVFLAALQGTVQLIVVDSTHQTIVAEMVAGPYSPALEANASNTFGGTASGAVYRLRVNAAPYGSTARFRFQVYAIKQAPERALAAFTFGDTVSGETIDPMVDIDQFIAHGDSGQEIVAVAETPGPAGSGAVGLIVIDPVANTLIGFADAVAGTSNPLTTGRMRLAGTHDYRFTLSSVISNLYPRYQGPYRFWTYVINRAPEHRAPPIPFNTEIANERIDRAGDVDEFTFDAAAGDDYNAFVQGGGRSFQLEIAPQGGSTLAFVTSQASDTALFAHATNRFHIANAGTYLVRMTAANQYEVADTGAYRFYLYKIDRPPEHVPETIAAGDTVIGEDIALPGDVDEFTFSGATGEEFNAFLQAENGSVDAYLQLEVVDPGGAVVRLAQSVGSDTGLLGQPTGRFALTGTGTYRLRVSGAPPYGSVQYRGRYRLFLYRVNRGPEALPDTLTFGDSLSGEAIDLPGDVDEFRVTVPDTSSANLAVAFDGQPLPGMALVVRLVDSVSGQVIAEAAANQSIARVATGRLRLTPGHYLLGVDTRDDFQDHPIAQGPIVCGSIDSASVQRRPPTPSRSGTPWLARRSSHGGTSIGFTSTA